MPEVIKATRDVLCAGASQIKSATGAGLASPFDPFHAAEFTVEEIHAIVTECEHWGTYAMAHSFSRQGTINAIEAGVKSIEHGYDTYVETMKLMKKKGVTLSTQFHIFNKQPQDFTAQAKDFSPYDILLQATKNGADAVAMTGKLNPYAEVPLGVIREGDYADLLLVGGNPLEDIDLLADPGKNLILIMKDGLIHKNTLE